MLTGNLASCSDDLSVRRLRATSPALHASSHRARSPPSHPASPSWVSHAGSSRHRITPRGLPETISATASRADGRRRRPATARRRRASRPPSRPPGRVRRAPPGSRHRAPDAPPRSTPSSLRIEVIADDLPLDGSPTTACHSTSGSDQTGVMRTATARAADAGESRQHCLHDVVRGRAGRRGRVAHPVAPGSGQQIERKRRNGAAPFLQDAEIHLGPTCRGRPCGKNGTSRSGDCGRNAGIERETGHASVHPSGLGRWI